MSYRRVAPRDLFNEAKLLKCLGRLALLIHDGRAPRGLSFEESGGPFIIDQSIDGDLSVEEGITFTAGRTSLRLATPYNNREAWPLLLIDDDLGSIGVFDEEGNLSAEFCERAEEIAS